MARTGGFTMALARLAETFPPAIVNWPPAYRSLPDTASAHTQGPYKPPPTPEPSAVQVLPFHLAMLVAALPPAVVNSPPAYTSLPETASAYTVPFTSEPRLVQVLPFHLAM